ncbi:Unknown protein, partial [Striga hermonthica]
AVCEVGPASRAVHDSPHWALCVRRMEFWRVPCLVEVCAGHFLPNRQRTFQGA